VAKPTTHFDWSKILGWAPHIRVSAQTYFDRILREKNENTTHIIFLLPTMKLVIALLALASASAFTTTSPFINKAVKFSTRYVT
jgi:hypothetical protein